MSLANQHLFELLTVSDRMMDLAERGTENQRDAECGIVYATLHDNARHLRKLANTELQRHFANGWFDEDDRSVARTIGLNV